MDQEDLMTLAQAAKYAGVPKRTLLAAAKKGKLKAERRTTFTGEIWLTTRKAVDAWKVNWIAKPKVRRSGRLIP